MNIDNVLKSHGVGVGEKNIKSIQKVSFIMNSGIKNIIINSVNPNNTIVIPTVTTKGSETNISYFSVQAYVNSTNNVLVTSTGYSSNIYVTLDIIEFNNVRSSQSGTFTGFVITDSSAGYVQDVAITSVNTEKSLIFSCFTIGSSSDPTGLLMVKEFINSTTISFKTRYNYNQKVYWKVIELK